MYVYGACLFYVCCSDCVGVCYEIIWSVLALTSQILVLRFGGNLNCNLGKMYFSLCLLLYSIFSISFSQEEPIHDFWRLLRIRSL